MAKDNTESDAERRERHRHEEAHDLVPDSTRKPDGAGYTAGVRWEDKARMALARRPRDRTDQDWEAIGRHEDPPSGVTGEPGWDTRRGHSGS